MITVQRAATSQRRTQQQPRRVGRLLDGQGSDFLEALVAELAKEHPETDAEDITRIVGESCSAVQMFDLTDDPDVVSLVGILARPELRLGLGLERKRLA